MRNKETRRASWKAFQQRNPGYSARYAKAWRERHPEKVEQYRVTRKPQERHYDLSRRVAKYKLTVSEFNELLQQQDGRCGICKRPSMDFVKGLSIDHRHADSTVRGLLCHRCNTAIGLFGEDPVRMRAAIAYLELLPLPKNNGPEQ